MAVSVFQGALKYDGAGPGIVYGVFPAAAPLLVIGAALAARSAAREEWPLLGIAVAVIVLGTGSAFAGPAGVWGVIAVGGCALAVAYGVVHSLLRRARPSSL